MKRFLKFTAVFLLISICSITFICCDKANDSDKENKKDVLSTLGYVYGEEETVTPFWDNQIGGYTIVYNEVVTPIQYGSDAVYATGYLAYEPAKIISVRDYTLQREYGENDYTSEGNAITVSTDGSMPYICNEWLDYKNIPEKFSDLLVEAPSYYNDKGGTNRGKRVISEGSLTRTNHLCVTYAYKTDENQLGFDVPEYEPEKFERVLSKLEKGEPIKMLVFGDSIFTGASASSVVGFEPGLPSFFELVKGELARRYYNGDTGKITLVNPSVGGTLSDWGAEQVESGAFDMSGYDLVIIGFGMNDGCEQFDTSPSAFAYNIERVIEGIRENSPAADYLVVGSFTPNPKSIFAGNHADFIEPVKALCEKENTESSGCAYLSMYEMSASLLANKQKNNTKDTRYQYIDLSSNYTNHPNDFTVRLYAGAILSKFCSFDVANN